MLVLTRKKHESLLIDGRIRVEVVSLARATVRLRLTAPRSLQLSRRISRREPRAASDPGPGEGSLGVEVLHATMVNQQFLSLGEHITLGILDADQARVLLFVEAPLGTAVAGQEMEPRKPGRQSTSQNLLQFMKPNTDRPETPPEPTAEAVPPPRLDDRPEEPPKLLPFPRSTARQARG